jgi:class 3 adenylate cyclase/tetratricopeptide (TPR) repeat protein
MESLDGEHKQVTMLCGALAEALALVARLGPEAMHYLMRDVLALAQDTVQRYDGTIIHVSGEGFLALFGAPVAQEDHARRAVVAALELRQRLRAPDALRGQPHGVTVRLGLHTGPVVVGSLAHDPQRPYTAAGDTLHLAARLQQWAAPDTILVSAATYALVQDEVQGEVCEALALDAPSTPVPVYAVHGLMRRRAGVPRRGARPLSRFVGRTQELALLHARLEQAIGGQGQVIGIAGEPGLGKSRLLAEFAHNLRGRPVTVCAGHCLAYGSAIPYLPLRDLLQQLWGLHHAASAPAITATIHERLHEARVASEAEALLLFQLLDVPVDLVPLAALSPQERKAQTFALLRHLIRHASQRQPLVLAVENLHWSDPTSDEWLASLVEQLADTPVLLLATYRPGYQPPWLRHSVATQMALPRLSPRDSLAVLRSIPQAAQLPVSLHQAIVAKAAGNPFFVEELTWAAMAHGAHAGSLPLPDTIEAVLAARIDRLPPEEKRLVQSAAVIGPEVPVPLLQRIAGLPEDTLQRSLAHLQSVELLYETRRFPDQVYTFKHALTHEVAYGSLLQERRRALHAQIVDVMETLYAGRLGEQAERLAHHALRGEVWDKALCYYRQAGTMAEARSAYREAVVCCEQALCALQHLPESRETIEQALDLRFDLRHALFEFAEHKRIFAYLREAETLAKALGDQRRLGWVFSYMIRCFCSVSDYDRAIASGERALAIAAALGDLGLQAATQSLLGQACYFPGDYARGIDFLKRNVASLKGELLRERFGLHIPASIYSYTWLVASLAELGAFAEGIACSEEMVRIAESINQPASVVPASFSTGLLYLRKGDLHKATAMLAHGLELSQVWDFRMHVAQTASHLGYAYALSGRVAEAVPLLEQAVGTNFSTSGMNTLRITYLSEAYLLAGRRDEAIQLARRTLELARQYNELSNQAWILRLFGNIHSQGDPPDIKPAEASYCQALILAKELGMRPLQAHCHRGLGTLYVQIGRREQARAALTTAIDLYRDMDMTFWLPQAEAALAQVG